MTARIAIIALAALCVSPAAAASWHETVLHAFSFMDTRGPDGNLVADRAGNLYGTTPQGGAGNAGTVYQVTADGTFDLIYEFGSVEGQSGFPHGIAIDRNGDLYIAAQQGAGRGAVFKGHFSGGQWTFEAIVHFCQKTDCKDGSQPGGPLTIGSDGAIYGTTSQGGEFGRGTVFKLKQAGQAWRIKTLHSFCSLSDCADGTGPQTAGLLRKGDTLYGTAPQDDVHGGTLYSLKTTGDDFRVLHSFGQSSDDGGFPETGVVADKNGVLYGTTTAGGVTDCGTVYSYDPASEAYAVLYRFCQSFTDGLAPRSQLLVQERAHGVQLIGTFSNGGAGAAGGVFSLKPPGHAGHPWKQKILHAFCSENDCEDGGFPETAGLIERKGVFYGTTGMGGSGGDGVIYALAPE